MSARRDTLTRRRLLQVIAFAGGGLLSGPLARALDDSRMVARIFFNSYGTLALRQAIRYAGEDGFVASLPQLLHARVGASYDNIIWNTWFTANSEENVVTTPQGNRVLVTVHGGGIFSDPDRIERTLRANLDRHNAEGLTGQYAAKITQQEAHDLLKGRLPDGSEIPVYTFSELKSGIRDLPRRYAVVLDFANAVAAKDDYEHFDTLADEPITIVRAGGPEPLAAYIEKARRRNNTTKMGNTHRLDRIDPAQPQTRILKLGGAKGGKNSDGSDLGLGRGYDIDWGISAGGLVDLARYVAVAPRDVSTSLQYLDFEMS